MPKQGRLVLNAAALSAVFTCALLNYAIIPLDTIELSASPVSTKIPYITKEKLPSLLVSLKKAIDDATRLLYKDSPRLSFWLEQPLPTVYIYDSLDPEWANSTLISECIDHHYLEWPVTNSRNSSIDDYKGNCLWRPNTICTDQVSPTNYGQTKFLTYRNNYHTDIQFLEWFYNYPLQTRDPKQADFFLIPYPHWSHCLCHKDDTARTKWCNLNKEDIEKHVLSKNNRELKHYHSHRHRHLWLVGTDWAQVRVKMRSLMPFALHLGASECDYCNDDGNDAPCGGLVTPYSDTSHAYQPSILHK